MGKVQLLDHLEPVAVSERHRRGRPFADAVHGQDHGVVEGGGKERRRRVALVVLCEEEPILPVEARVVLGELAAQQVLLKQLFPEPYGHGHPKRRESPGREAQIRLEQALELQERLVIECHVIHVPKSDVPGLEAIGDGVRRKAGVVLLAREPLLLGGREDRTVLDEDGGAVVIEGGNAEDAHPGPLKRWCR